VLNRLRNARNQVLAIWKWCLSFRKTDWSLGDYPVIIRKQQPDTTDRPSRLKTVPYLASILNWNLIGNGDTKLEALADLKTKFAKQKAERRAKHEPLPRPGTHVPIQFAASDRVEAHRALADDFIHRVLELEWAWISDDSSLWDFHTEETNDALVTKVKEVYGCDISDISSGRLCEIFERIVKEDKFQRWG
jgi:hypothetical protein